MQDEHGPKTRMDTPGLLVAALLVAVPFGGVTWALRFLPTPIRAPWWLTALPLVAALLVVLLMRAARYPPGGGQLLIGVPLLALIVGVVGVPVGTARPAAPAGLPPEISELPVAGPNLPPDVDAAVVFRRPDSATPLTVEFSTVVPIAGYWAFTAGVVQGDAFTVRAQPRAKSWGETIVTGRGSGPGKVTPSYRVELPLTEALDHTDVTATASIDLVYPARYGVNEFVDNSASLGRRVRLFVGSPRDLEFRQALDSWRDLAEPPVDHRTYTGAVGGLGLLSLLLVAIGALRVNGARGVGGLPTFLADIGIVVREQVCFGSGVRSSAVVDAPPAGSPAERAGVRSGDVFFLVDGVPPLGGRRTDRRLRRRQGAGWTHRLAVLRDGRTVSIELEAPPDDRQS